MYGLIIDCFAGGGGASQGIEQALGRPCDVAVNHDPKAIAMHKANHPATHHMTEDIWQADLEGYADGRHVSLMWASPDCTHFSKAKGGTPRNSGIRMLPWAVHMHAKNLNPDIIIMENVSEIQTWGPLGDDGRPIKAEEGKEYARFIDHMRDLGYTFECRELVAADYGAPTSRKRWYAVMRRDGKRTVWPERDHAPAGDPSGLAPYVPAASVIDWSLPCPSVFADRAAIKEAFGVAAVRPLAEKTLRRIARGLDRYVVSCDDPFIVAKNAAYLPINNNEAIGTHPMDPLSTVTTGGHKMLAGACLTEYFGNAADGLDVRDPLRTVTTRDREALTVAYLTQTAHAGDTFRGGAAAEPLRTISSRDREGLTMAYLTAYYGGPHGGSVGQGAAEPLRTITTASGAHFGVVSAYLAQTGYGERPGQVPRTYDLHNPLPTVVAGGVKQALCAPYITEFYGMGVAAGCDMPLHTVTTSAGHFGVVRAELSQDMGRWPEVRALLNEHCGYKLRDDEVLVTWIGGEPHYISDIGLRMLTPEELKLAQGFPDDYIIDHYYDGTPVTKTQQVRMIGNSVVPVMAKKLVSANMVA